MANDDVVMRRYIDARYSGQVYEIETPVPSNEILTVADMEHIVTTFEDAHDTLYHYRMTGYPAEFVSCRVEAVGRVAVIAPKEAEIGSSDPTKASKGTRRVFLPGAKHHEDVGTFDGDKLEPGNKIAGVAIIETEGSTLVVWENQHLTVNRFGDFEIDIG